MDTAGEGGPYGMALLCSFMLWKEENETLEDYLDGKVFNGCSISTIKAEEKEVEGFNQFIESYRNCLDVERKAIQCWKN